EVVSSMTTDSNGGIVETRGDGATRALTYHGSGSGGNCLPELGKLLHYTDFLGHTTTLAYDAAGGNWESAHFAFIQSVTDPNGHITQYDRQTSGWGITKITHPDGSYISQTFWAAPNDTNSQ